MNKLTIITINYNNASGLSRTIDSVLNQTSLDFEYIIVDGASTDTSCQVIREKGFVVNGELELNGIMITCISEPDTGIYNAMNKGIHIAKGEYIQFLNSGDLLASPDIIEKMLTILKQKNSDSRQVDILYGNMLKQMQGSLLRDKGFAGRQPTMLDFYRGTLNHSSAYIRKSLFESYGFYDESLKIVSDWKWYLQVIVFGHVEPVYTDMDVTIFDMTGISETNQELNGLERRKVLQELLPDKILADYDKWWFGIEQLQRIKRYKWADMLLFVTERVLFKWEKIRN